MWLPALTGALAFGCGGSGEGQTEDAERVEPQARTSGGEGQAGGTGTGTGARPSEWTGGASAAESSGDAEVADDGMEVEGILGSMAQATIRRAMSERANAFIECFTQRYDALPVLGGAATLSFRVRGDGRVRWVHLVNSTVGDRQTERCVLRIAAAMRFSPGPVGGDAEFQDTVELPAPDDVRAPVSWQPARLRATLRSSGTSLRSCNVPGDSLRVTVYVDPGGTAAAVGAAFVPRDPEEDSQAALDCVTQMVARWPFPDPGSYSAMVTFEAP